MSVDQVILPANAEGLFTPASLLAYAEFREQQYRELVALHPPGTFHEGRNVAHDDYMSALNCSAWLEEKGIAATGFVGPYSCRSYKKGDRVRIKSGARIRSTAPHPERKTFIATRARVVTVHDFYKGSVTRISSDGPEVNQGQVHWVGAGGYWHWTDAHNIELEDVAVATAPA